MGWRFRKSFSPLPGVRLTLSPNGISTSVGVGPLRLTAGPRGPAFTATLPGTGLSFHQSLASHGTRESAVAPELFDVPPAVQSAPELQAIESAGSSSLTTVGLAEFKRLLEEARREHGETSRHLAHWRMQEAGAVAKYKNWEKGWLLRRLFASKFEQLRSIAEEASAHRAELEEQEQLSKLKTQFDLPTRVVQTFHRLCDEFSIASKAQRIWDTVGQRDVNRAAERTAATRVIARKPVKFHLDKCELIEAKWSAPHLQNANGGDIYFYPAFALYFVTAESFALIEYKEIQLTYRPIRFIEEETVPSDAKVVGSTWAKTNKDGSPDRRFKENYRIPVAEYGRLLIKSTSGMNEEYMLSDAASAERFANALSTHANAVITGG